MPRPKAKPDPASLPRIPANLSLSCLLAWWAFERSTSRALRVSPSDRLSSRLFRELEEALAFSATTEGSRTARRSLLGPWCWQYSHSVGFTGDQLCVALQRAISAYQSRDSWQLECSTLWRSLVDAESFEYLLHLLAQHHLDLPIELASGSALAELWAEHSLGRRRYLAWYAVRGASAALLRSGLNQASAGQALQDELRRRSRWLLHSDDPQSNNSSNYCFAPPQHRGSPLMVQLFLSDLAPIGSAYWSRAPGPLGHLQSPTKSCIITSPSNG